jgi:hypothetical protein
VAFRIDAKPAVTDRTAYANSVKGMAESSARRARANRRARKCPHAASGCHHRRQEDGGNEHAGCNQGMGPNWAWILLNRNEEPQIAARRINSKRSRNFNCLSLVVP